MRYPKLLALIPALLLCAVPVASHAAIAIGVSVNIAPPVLPVYVQPPLPAPGYIWTPGYWAWDGSDYYWVPGTWVEPPVSGLLWTPGYWGWVGGAYVWNAGYWAPQVGFYGGVDYGFGYPGVGFRGGYWHGGAFFYNRAVANFGHVNIVNVYNAPVPHGVVSRVSFNGGEGGLRAQPTPEERRVMNERHVAATSMQIQHAQHAAGMPAMHFHQNGGRPQVLTTQRAGDFAHAGPGLHDRREGAGPREHEGAPRGGEPQNRSFEQRGNEQRGNEQRGNEQRGFEQRGGEQRGAPRMQPQQHEQAPRAQAPHEQHGQGRGEDRQHDR
ncbi:MAG TPA: hypothetical protein VMF03_04510 [Steroidobacteraceae bacterium]|nr:hypothetical protein [Steroidobacteraceae bacterium]